MNKKIEFIITTIICILLLFYFKNQLSYFTSIENFKIFYDEYVIKFPNTHPAGHGIMIDVFDKGADRFLKLLTAEKSTSDE